MLSGELLLLLCTDYAVVDKSLANMNDGQMLQSSTVSQPLRTSTTSGCSFAARCELDRRWRRSIGSSTTTTRRSWTESRSETTGASTWCVRPTRGKGSQLQWIRICLPIP